MAFERTREFLLRLPWVEETLQWDALVFWAGDKAVGGKMFAIAQPEPGARDKQPYVLAFAVPQASYLELLELEGLRPAPYLARAYWIAVEGWTTMSQRELHAHLQRAYERVRAALPRETQRLLEGSDRDYRAAVRAARASTKSAPKRPA